MINMDTVVSYRKDIDTTDLNGDIVMMDLEKGKYFSLNGVGSKIWNLIDEPVQVSKIVESLLGEYDVEREECEKSVLDFLGKLDDEKIIVIG